MSTKPPPSPLPAAESQDSAAGSREADIWRDLRASTPARIGLGRVGDTMPLRPVLDFQLAHAEARDAVHAALDIEAMRAGLAPRPTLAVTSAAVDRSVYLRRPDLGRALSEASNATLAAACTGRCDCVFVIADGLSATAASRHAAPLLALCLPRLTRYTMAPIVIASQARVALGDAIGAGLGARLAIVLIGERPGLSVADSLGVYMTYAPRIGRRDSERNCISNIHRRGGLDYDRAATTLCWLAGQALERGITGITLKESGDAARLPVG